MFFLLFLLDDRRIRIRISNRSPSGRPKSIWILRIRIRKTDLTVWDGTARHLQNSFLIISLKPAFPPKIPQRFHLSLVQFSSPLSSVADPDPNPDPPDPHVFGPPGSGSGSFYQHAKIVRKTLIPTIL
jgi:hypothetical protein